MNQCSLCFFTATGGRSHIRRRLVPAGIAALLLFAAVTASAEDETLKDGAKKAGHTAGSVVREIGQGATQVGKTIGKAAREGGKEFNKAVKGESK